MMNSSRITFFLLVLVISTTCTHQLCSATTDWRLDTTTSNTLQTRTSSTAPWQYLCIRDNFLTTETARGLCSILGYSQLTSTPTFSTNTKPQNLTYARTQITCPRFARSFSDCRSSSDLSNCTDSDALHLDCHVASGTYGLLLAPDNSGKVYVRKTPRDDFQLACIDKVDQTTASKLCNFMNFNPTSTELNFFTTAGAATETFAIDELTCPSSASALRNVAGDCGFDTTSNCALSQSLALSCGPDLSSLTAGYFVRSTNTGLLEVRKQDSTSWGSICGDASFDLNAAKMFCSVLGHSTANVAFDKTGRAQSGGTVQFHALSCPLGSVSLGQCSFVAGAGSGSTLCTHSTDVSVYCTGNTPAPTSANSEEDLVFGKYTYTEVAGTVVGSVLGFLALLFMIYLCKRHKKNKEGEEDGEENNNNNSPTKQHEMKQFQSPPKRLASPRSLPVAAVPPTAGVAAGGGLRSPRSHSQIRIPSQYQQPQVRSQVYQQPQPQQRQQQQQQQSVPSPAKRQLMAQVQQFHHQQQLQQQEQQAAEEEEYYQQQLEAEQQAAAAEEEEGYYYPEEGGGEEFYYEDGDEQEGDYDYSQNQPYN